MIYSIIIPFFNERDDILNTVNACLFQRFPSNCFEIVLIDDGSTDNSYSICLEHFSSVNNVKVLHYTDNKGVAYARNIGARYSNGDVLVFLNADEIIGSDFLTAVDWHYQRGADYVFPQTRVKNRNTAYGLFRDCYRQNKYNTPNKFLWSQGFSCRKVLFFSVNGFNELYPGCGGEDWDFTVRIEKQSANRVVDLSIVVEHVVPSDTRDILWHMYNRGRGSAYYDIISNSRKPIPYLVRIVSEITAFLCFAYFQPLSLTFFLAYWMYRYLCYIFRLQKHSNGITAFLCLFYYALLDKTIRKTAYIITMLNNAHGINHKK